MNSINYVTPKAKVVKVWCRKTLLAVSPQDMGAGKTTDFNDGGDISDAFDED